MTQAVIFFQKKLIHETCYILGPIEEDMGGDQNLQEVILPFSQAGSNNSTTTAKQIREMLLDYWITSYYCWKSHVEKITIQSKLHNFDENFIYY